MPEAESLFTKSPHSTLPAGIEQTDQGELFVDPALLMPNPQQPREDFDETALAELASSIREKGIIEPVVIEDALNGSFYIIAGERRTRAARLAGLTRIPVVLKKYSDREKLEIALIENVQREDLNPIEEAQAYHKLMELENISQDELAKRVGKARATIANAVRLLKLPTDMQAALVAGKLSSGHARALLSVLDPVNRRLLFERIQAEALSVRDSEKDANDLNGKLPPLPTPPAPKVAPAAPAAKVDPDFAHIEQQFIEALGTKVSVKGDFERGSITIEFYSRDDLDRLYALLIDEPA
jgi:ParB family chromosome partitioning protein